MTYKMEPVTAGIAEALCRQITADLPEYFGLPQANEQYFSGVRVRENFSAKIDGKYVGLLSLDFKVAYTGIALQILDVKSINRYELSIQNS